jgi:hypothetical protein
VKFDEKQWQEIEASLDSAALYIGHAIVCSLKKDKDNVDEIVEFHDGELALMKRTIFRILDTKISKCLAEGSEPSISVYTP